MGQQLDFWLKLAGLLATMVTAFWAYTRFVLERGLLPPSEFTVDCTPIGEHGGRKILEILLRIKNAGSATLIVSNLRLDIRYLQDDGETLPKGELLFRDPEEDRFGTLRFPESLTKNDLDFAGQILVGKKGDILEYRNGHIEMKEQRVLIVQEKHEDGKTRGEKILGGEIVKRPKKAEPRKAERRGGRGIPILSYDTFVQPGVNQVYSFVTALPASVTCVLVYSSFRYGAHPRCLEKWVLKIARGVGIIQYSLSHISEPHTAQRVFNVADSPKAAAP